MPRGDGTGPAGMGPMTGRAAGFCAGFGAPGYANRWAGCGFGMGFGRGRARGSRLFGGGRGWRNWFYATGLPHWMRGSAAPQPDPDVERQVLRNQTQALQEQLDSVQRRLAEIDAGTERQ